MTTIADGQALLAAILEHPSDDDRRLVYADWLDEAGEGGRAEFIREAIRWPCTSFVNLTRDDPFPLLGMGPGEPQPVSGWDDDGNRQQRMRTWMWGESEESGLLVHDLGRRLDYRVERGFVESVRCPLDAWLEHGPAIVRAHPVTRVELTDVKAYPPSRDLRVALFHPDVPGNDPDWGRLTAGLFRLLEGHDNGPTPTDRVKWYAGRRQADDAVSDAALAWAKLPEEERL